MRIEDFSLLLDEIPIAKEEYNNNPDLLAAMMVAHIEDVCQGEAQAIEEMEDDELYSQETCSQVASIHFGLTSQNCMRHLVAIYDLVKQIAVAKKRMQNDPLGSRKYEKEIWILYQRVTDHKDAYYFDKMNSEPLVKNAYVTFRSMEGKHRAL